MFKSNVKYFYINSVNFKSDSEIISVKKLFLDSDKELTENEDDELLNEETIKKEGYLYKLGKSNSLKKYWVKLYNKDLFCIL